MIDTLKWVISPAVDFLEKSFNILAFRQDALQNTVCGPVLILRTPKTIYIIYPNVSEFPTIAACNFERSKYNIDGFCNIRIHGTVDGTWQRQSRQLAENAPSADHTLGDEGRGNTMTYYTYV